MEPKGRFDSMIDLFSKGVASYWIKFGGMFEFQLDVSIVLVPDPPPPAPARTVIWPRGGQMISGCFDQTRASDLKHSHVGARQPRHISSRPPSRSPGSSLRVVPVSLSTFFRPPVGEIRTPYGYLTSVQDTSDSG